MLTTEVFHTEKNRSKILIKVEKHHSPIKMKNIKRNINYKGNSNMDIEINKNTILIEQSKIKYILHIEKLWLKFVQFLQLDLL